MLLSNLSNVIEEKATHLKAIEVKNNETTLLLSLMKEKDKKLANEKEIMNSTAEYMANYDKENLTAFSEIEDDFGDMRFILYRDMGMVLPAPIRATEIFLGAGEVIDGPPPSPPAKISLKCKRNPFGMDKSAFLPFFKSVNLRWNPNNPQSNPNVKGKAKMYPNLSFNKNGAPCDEAIKILDEGKLSGVLPFCSKQLVDLRQIWRSEMHLWGMECMGVTFCTLPLMAHLSSS
ncbi:hypothetical protein ACET3Z_031437 [Daucus carota]